LGPGTEVAYRWKDELERCSGDDFTIGMYYGNNRGGVVDALESGADVLVTSYGTMASDYAKWEDGGRNQSSGLYGGPSCAPSDSALF
jgi:hypothetical protein